MNRRSFFAAMTGGLVAGAVALVKETPKAAAKTPGRSVHVSLQGRNYTREDVLELIKEINAAHEDGAVMRV